MPPSRTKATSRRARQWHLPGSKGGGSWGGVFSKGCWVGGGGAMGLVKGEGW